MGRRVICFFVVIDLFSSQFTVSIGVVESKEEIRMLSCCGSLVPKPWKKKKNEVLFKWVWFVNNGTFTNLVDLSGRIPLDGGL